MKSETALVATQLRYQQWMDDIRDCKARPAGVTVADWCAEHHITRETYYYRMRVLREACLDYTSIQSMSDTEEQASTVSSRFVELQSCYGNSTEATPVSVTIRIGNAAIEVADTISDEFLQRIVEVVSHA